jgi:hypothetical protein
MSLAAAAGCESVSHYVRALIRREIQAANPKKS